MKYDGLIKILGEYGMFDLATVAQLSGDSRSTILTQLNRWTKEGKLVALRRGMYAFAERYSRKAVNPAELANLLYVPSYISALWALGYYGLIPERVVTYTSITTRVPRTFENDFGVFKYQNIKAAAFFGYMPVQIDGRKILLAEPEKALLDMWHLEKGQWGESRMTEMRFQNYDVVSIPKLRRYADRFDSPRLAGAVETWRKISISEAEGTVVL